MLTRLATSSWLVLCLLVSFDCGLKVKVVRMIECDWHLNLFTNVENVCIGVLSRSREISRKVFKTLLSRGGYFNKLIFFRKKPNVLRNRVSSDRKLLENHTKKIRELRMGFFGLPVNPLHEASTTEHCFLNVNNLKRVSMGWWLLRLSAKILAILRLSVNFFQLRLTKKLKINFFCFKKLNIN